MSEQAPKLVEAKAEREWTIQDIFGKLRPIFEDAMALHSHNIASSEDTSDADAGPKKILHSMVRFVFRDDFKEYLNLISTDKNTGISLFEVYRETPEDKEHKAVIYKLSEDGLLHKFFAEKTQKEKRMRTIVSDIATNEDCEDLLKLLTDPMVVKDAEKQIANLLKPHAKQK